MWESEHVDRKGDRGARGMGTMRLTGADGSAGVERRNGRVAQRERENWAPILASRSQKTRVILVIRGRAA